MKPNLIYTGCCLLMLCLMQAACDDDEHDNCPHPKKQHVLTIRSYDGVGNEIIGTDAVSEVMLYVFDAQNRFLKSIPCKENETVGIDYPEQQRITIAGWGNSRSSSQNMPQPTVGALLGNLQMTLLHSTDGYLLSPDDLFFGSVNIDYSAATRASTITHLLKLQRRVASMEILVKGISGRFDTSDTDFTLQVSETAEGINFLGELSTTRNKYRPECRFNTLQELVAPVFHTLPSKGKAVTVTLYKGGTPVYETSADNQGKPLILETGKLLSVFIDLGGNPEVNVSFIINPWNESNINQEF